jgi:hypothetical protein
MSFFQNLPTVTDDDPKCWAAYLLLLEAHGWERTYGWENTLMGEHMDGTPFFKWRSIWTKSTV